MLAEADRVDFHLPAGSTSTKQLMLAQFYLPGVEFDIVDDPLAPSMSRYVFARPDNEQLEQSTARMVWRQPGRPVALWVR